MEDKDLDGLVDEFAVNGFPLDGDKFRETLRQHFGPVFNSLRERVKALEEENREQHYKLTKACVEGGYDICARCGDAVRAEEMDTISAYRKKAKSLDEARKLCEAVENIFYGDDWDEGTIEIKELAADLLGKIEKNETSLPVNN